MNNKKYLNSGGNMHEEGSDFLPHEHSIVEFTQIPIGGDEQLSPTQEIIDDSQSVVTTSTIYLPNQETIAQNRYRDRSPRTSNMLQKYRVIFTLKYDAKPGETVAVVGDNKVLGNMEDHKLCPMKLKKDTVNIWQSSQIEFNKMQKIFMYKYVIIKAYNVKFIEKGFNRLADLDILPDQSLVLSQQSTSGKSSQSYKSANSNKEFKEVIIDDEWQSYKIKFSVFDPLEENSIIQEDHMSLVGLMQVPQADGKIKIEKTPPIRMTRSMAHQQWMYTKYGQLQKPWELVLSFKSDQVQLPLEIFYFYSKRKNDGNQVVREREPNRSLILMPPESYKGRPDGYQNISHQQDEQVWILNGVVDKTDANFLGGLFFDKIGDTNIVIGTYPLNERDILKMKDIGITSVINLQTDEEFKQRKINWKNIKDLYKTHQIKCYRFPISDVHENQFCASLFVGAQHLNSLINVQNENLVFIHCSSGMSRAPAVVITYLCLFKRVKQWQITSLVAQYVKAFHVNSQPNLKAINKTIQNNLPFQKQQLDVYYFQQSRSPSPLKDDDDTGSDIFYLPQKNEAKKKDFSLSPSRKYIPVRGLQSYSRKLFQKSQPIRNKITKTPEKQPQISQFEVTQQSQKTEEKKEITKFEVNQPQIVQPIIQKMQPETHFETVQVENNPPSQSNDMASLPVNYQTAAINEFIEENTIIVSNDFQRSVRENDREKVMSCERTPQISPRNEFAQEKNDVELKHRRQNFSQDIQPNRLKQHLQSLQNNNKKEVIQSDQQNEIDIMAKLEAEDREIREKIAQIAAQQEQLKKEEEAKERERIRIQKEEEAKRLEELAIKAAEEERKRVIRRKADQKRYIDEIKIINGQLTDDYIDEQIIKVVKEVFTAEQEELQKQWRLKAEQEAAREAQKKREIQMKQQIEERHRMIEIEKKQRDIEQQILNERQAILREVQQERKLERDIETVSPTRYMNFHQRKEQYRRQKELEKIEIEKQQIEKQKQQRLEREQKRREQELLERQELERKLEFERNERQRIEKERVEEQKRKEQDLINKQKMEEEEKNRKIQEEEKKRQIEIIQRQEEELLAARLAKKAEEKRQREQQQMEIEIQRQKEQERLKEAQSQLEILRQQRLAEEQKLIELREQYKVEEKQRQEKTAEIKRQLEEKIKMEMFKSISPQKNYKVNTAKMKITKSDDNSDNSLNNSLNRGVSFQNDIALIQEEINDNDTSIVSEFPFNKREKDLKELIVEQNLSERKIEYYCDLIFSDAPIKFVPEKGNQLEECISKLMKKYRITIPIIKVKDQEKVYLLGTQRHKMEYKYQSVIIKIGSNTERFDQYVPKTQRRIQRQIIENMAKSQKNLYDVVEMHYKGQRVYTKSSIPKMVSLHGIPQVQSYATTNDMPKQVRAQPLNSSLNKSKLNYVPVKNVNILNDRERSSSLRSRDRSSSNDKRYVQNTISSANRISSFEKNIGDFSDPKASMKSPNVAQLKWKKLHHLKKVNITLKSRDGSQNSRRSSDSRGNYFQQDPSSRPERGSNLSLSSMGKEHRLTGKFYNIQNIVASITPRSKPGESLHQLVTSHLKSSRQNNRGMGDKIQTEQPTTRFGRYQSNLKQQNQSAVNDQQQ